MSTDWDLLIENHFDRKSENKLTLDTLLSAVNEVMKSLEGDSYLLTERMSNPKSIDISYDAIPAIPLSELGWAGLESNNEAAQASRAQLEQFLSRIGGNDLRTKLSNLSKVLNDPARAQKLISIGGTSSASKISNTLAYLVFFKTLTQVITNFNAASAGFNFESFLAVLLGGAQIPASGADTIADITDERGTPLSLKLYNEKTLKSGGSYVDLIGDLVKSPYYMQYVVVAKTLKGKSTSRTGGLDFMRYNITSDNVMNLLLNGAYEGHKSYIRLPQAVVSGEQSLKFRIPKVPSLGQIRSEFNQILLDSLGDVEWAEDFVDLVDYGEDKDLFTKTPGLSSLKRTPRGASMKRIISGAAKLAGVEETREFKQRIHKLIYDANEMAIKKPMKAMNQLRKIRGGAASYATPEQSVQFFNRLSSADKRRALMLTYGYSLPGAQYALTRADIYDIQRLARDQRIFPSGQNEVSIGKLEIGQDKVEEMLTTMINDINQSVFEIFGNVKVLSDSLQSYFANELNDSSMADKAIKAANDIEAKTKEVSGTE